MTQSASSIRVVVLVSIGRHPVSGVPRWSRNDARALSLAFSLAPQQASIEVIHAGCAQHAALPDYLALGVKILDVVSVARDTDIVSALAERLRNADLIICGSRAEGQEDSGMLPYLLAEQLDTRLVPSVLKLSVEKDSVIAEQFLPKGRRRTVQADLPLIVTAHLMAPLNTKYAYAQRQAGRITAEQTLAPSVPNNAWKHETVRASPVRLAAREKRSGHARMLSATMTEARAGRVVDQGTPKEKAAAVITYLREHGLIDY